MAPQFTVTNGRAGALRSALDRARQQFLADADSPVISTGMVDCAARLPMRTT